MERFAAMVIGHRAAAAPVPAPAPAAKGKGKVVEDAAYLSIQLEEIVIVKNDDVASLGAARSRSSDIGGVPMKPAAKAVAGRA